MNTLEWVYSYLVASVPIGPKLLIAMLGFGSLWDSSLLQLLD